MEQLALDSLSAQRLVSEHGEELVQKMVDSDRYRSLIIELLSQHLLHRGHISNSSLSFKGITNIAKKLKIIAKTEALTYSHPLPPILLQHVFSYLPVNEILSSNGVAKVCRSFYLTARNPASVTQAIVKATDSSPSALLSLTSTLSRLSHYNVINLQIDNRIPNSSLPSHTIAQDVEEVHGLAAIDSNEAEILDKEYLEKKFYGNLLDTTLPLTSTENHPSLLHHLQASQSLSNAFSPSSPKFSFLKTLSLWNLPAENLRLFLSQKNLPLLESLTLATLHTHHTLPSSSSSPYESSRVYSRKSQLKKKKKTRSLSFIDDEASEADEDEDSYDEESDDGSTRDLDDINPLGKSVLQMANETILSLQHDLPPSLSSPIIYLGYLPHLRYLRTFGQIQLRRDLIHEEEELQQKNLLHQKRVNLLDLENESFTSALFSISPALHVLELRHFVEKKSEGEVLGLMLGKGLSSVEALIAYNWVDCVPVLCNAGAGLKNLRYCDVEMVEGKEMDTLLTLLGRGKSEKKKATEERESDSENEIGNHFIQGMPNNRIMSLHFHKECALEYLGRIKKVPVSFSNAVLLTNLRSIEIVATNWCNAYKEAYELILNESIFSTLETVVFDVEDQHSFDNFHFALLTRLLFSHWDFAMLDKRIEHGLKFVMSRNSETFLSTETKRNEYCDFPFQCLLNYGDGVMEKVLEWRETKNKNIHKHFNEPEVEEIVQEYEDKEANNLFEIIQKEWDVSFVTEKFLENIFDAYEELHELFREWLSEGEEDNLLVRKVHAVALKYMEDHDSFLTSNEDMDELSVRSEEDELDEDEGEAEFDEDEYEEDEYEEEEEEEEDEEEEEERLRREKRERKQRKEKRKQEEKEEKKIEKRSRRLDSSESEKENVVEEKPVKKSRRLVLSDDD